MSDRIPLVKRPDVIQLYDAICMHGGWVAAFEADGTVRIPESGYAVWGSPVPVMAPQWLAFEEFCAVLAEALGQFPNARHLAADDDGEFWFIGPVDVYETRATAEHFARLREETYIGDLSTGAVIPVGA